MEDSLLNQIAEKEAAHAKVVSDIKDSHAAVVSGLLAAKANVEKELADLKAKNLRVEDDYLEAAHTS
jgi:hypothetical protein